MTITIRPASTSFSPGTYLLDVVTPFESAQFTCEIPADPAPFACNCKSTAMTISACATHTDVSVFVGGRPPSASVRLLGNGVELVSHSIDPQYRTVQPNGPDCDPTCTVANETVAS